VDAAVADAPADVLVVYTLSDYIADAAVRARIRGECPERRRFPGTVGGGDIVVCQLR
jgi:hypothetical protein